MLLCVLGAATFWFFNSLNKSYSTQISHPVQYVFPEEDSIVVLTKLPESISLDVEGGGWNLFRKTFWFTVEPLEVFIQNPVELRHLTRADLETQLTPQLTELALKHVLNDTVKVNIEPLRQKVVSLIVDSANISLEEPYRIVSDIFINPDTLLVQGPKSYIDTLPAIHQISLPEREIDYNYDEELRLRLPPATGVTLSPGRAEVSFEVEPFIFDTYNIPLQAQNFPDDSVLMPVQNYLTISFRIQESLIGKLQDSLFLAVADYNNLNRVDSTLVPRLVKHPDYIEELTMIPKQIKIIETRSN